MGALFYLLVALFAYSQGVDGEVTVTIIRFPAGTPVSGSTNTFDYPILSSITLTCNVTSDDGSPLTVTGYSWNTTRCYANSNGERRCFPAGVTTQSVRKDYLLAKDAGTITCTATISSVDYVFTSNEFTLRISGISVTTTGPGLNPATDLVTANQLMDYSYLTEDLFVFDSSGVLLRCASGLGPTGSNMNLGGWKFDQSAVSTGDHCLSQFQNRGANSRLYPGVINLYPCGALSPNEEGVYSCMMMNSSMMVQTTRVGLYLSGRTAPIIDPPSSSTVTVSVGDSLTLSCTSQGSPPDTFTWMKDGSVVPFSFTLTAVNHNNNNAVFQSHYTINSVTSSDSGTYSCTVTNPIGSDSKAIIVVVLIGVTIVSTPAGTPVSGSTNTFDYPILSSVTMTCMVTLSNGEAFTGTTTYQWDTTGCHTNTAHNSGNPTCFPTGQTTQNVTDNNLLGDDAGTITCTVTLNGVDYTSNPLTLRISASPNIVVPVEGQEFTITEGSNRSITCTATGYPPPTVVWQNSDGSSLRLVSGSEVMSSTGVGNVTSVSVELMVTGAMRIDTGMYRCSASNFASNDTDVTVTITVQYGPTIIQQVIDQIQNEGDIASFACQATGEPVPTISWYFNDVPVDVTNSLKFNVVFAMFATIIINSLRINNVQSYDVGTYTCNATNVVSSDTSSGVLTVNASPNIVVPVGGQEFTITEGSNGLIACTTIGYPPPTVVWQNSDGSSLSNMRLVSGSEVMSSTGVGNVTSVTVELMITGAMRIDTGMYTCSASNIVSNDTDVTLTLTIQFAPEIPVPPVNTTVVNGDKAVLNCTVVGDPLPTISWYIGGVDLSLSNMAPFDQEGRIDDRLTTTITILNTTTVMNSLAINETIPFLAEDYMCVASNSLGSVNRSATLTVQDRPGATNTNIVDYGSRWIYIQWDIPYDGNSDIMGYNVYIRFVGTNPDFTLVMTSSSMGRRQANMFTTTANSYNVTEQILPFMRYQFVVVACNELGCGDLDVAEQSEVVRTDQEAPKTPPLNCLGTVVSSTSIRITWSHPVMSNGIITDYNVSYVPGQSLSTADYSTDGNVSINIGNNDTNTIVTDLRIATSYSITLAAHTVVGIGPCSNPMECVVQTLEDVPGGPPLSVTLSSPTSTSIAVSWQLPDPLVRNGIITKHQLNYTEVSQPLNWTTVSLDGDTSYVIEDLEIFTKYYVSVSAGTQIDGYGPFSGPVMIRTVPDGPINVTIQSVGEVTISLTWTEPTLTDETVLYYQVYYTPAGQGPTLSINSTTTSITLSDLVPGVEYSINVTAVTTTGGNITSTTVTAITLTTALFQLRLRPIPDCYEWIDDRQRQKLDDIISTLMTEIESQCSCMFDISSDSFSCRGAQENFENTVVYRARVSVQGPASLISADDVVNNITTWAESSPSMTIASVTLDIDPNCPAMLDSFNSADCVIVTEQPTPSPSSPTSSSSSSSSPTGVIVGVIFAVVIIIILLIIVVVVGVVMKYHKQNDSYSIKEQPENEYDYITPKSVGRKTDYPSPLDNKPVILDSNPAYQSMELVNESIDNSAEYETINFQPTSKRTEDAVIENPVYVETYFK